MCTTTGKPRTSSYTYGQVPLHIDEEENLEKDIFRPFYFNTSNRADSSKRAMLKLVGNWLEVPQDKLDIIEEIVHYSFNATLMYDDMQDNSPMRRGKPAVHTVYGRIRSAIAIDWTFAYILGIVHKLDNQEVNELIWKSLPRMVAGNGLEVYKRFKNTCPIEAEYYQMVFFQAAFPMVIAAKVLGILSKGKKRNLDKLLTAAGIYYQMLNDYRNGNDLEYSETRAYSNDFQEGHYGFPIVHIMNNFPEEGKIIQDIMEKRSCTDEETDLCLSLLRKCGSFEYTEKKMEELKEFMLKEVEQIDDSPQIKVLIENVILADTF